MSFQDAAVSLGRRVIWSHGTFSILPGEFVALIGPNGSGKTTMLRAILGQIPVSAGRLEVLSAPPRRGNRAIGLVSQRHTVEMDFAIRGRDLVMLGLNGHKWGIGRPSAAEKQAVEESLAAVAAQDYADEPVGVLSGGEQQRLMIAQALLTQPRLLLLDEPLSSLDVRSQAEIVALVKSLSRARGITVLLISHDLNPLSAALDRIIYILDGQPIAGTPDEVVSEDLLSRLYDTSIRVLRSPDGVPFVIGK